MKKEKRIKVNLTLSPSLYKEFLELAHSMGLSASFLLEVILYSICKHRHRFESIFDSVGDNCLSYLLEDLKKQYGAKLKKKEDK